MRRVLALVGKSVVRVLWGSLMVLVPLFGVWVASSLAAYRNASTALVVLAGLLLFPIVPVAWDLIFVWRRDKAKPAILTRLDRLVLRTLLVNGVFLGGLFWFAPQTAFRAIAVRGDWFLDGHDGDVATAIRSAILDFADHFSSRWHAEEQTYGTSDVAPEKPVAPPVSRSWPLDAAIDPAVRELPAASIVGVGAALAARFPDPRQRVKAIHDFVALRLTYDDDALAKRKRRPSQEAEDVFAARQAVCEGYAKLTAAIGKAAGLDIKYITGSIRDTRRRPPDSGTDEAIKAALEGYGHAWNAVQIDGAWQLLDVTWDDPSNGDIRTTYLLTPPAAFARDHLPNESAWQLLAKPLTVGEFARQPFMTPEADALQLALEQPTRSQVTTDGDLAIVLDNPRHLEVAGEVHGLVRCTTHALAGTRVEVDCKLPAGEHEVMLFAGEKPTTPGRYALAYVGSILANAR